jgi:hypothetical protein
VKLIGNCFFLSSVRRVVTNSLHLGRGALLLQITEASIHTAERAHHPPRYEVGVHEVVGAFFVGKWPRCLA